MKMNMKTNQLMAVLAAGMMWTGLAGAQTYLTNSFTFATGQSIPDGSADGLALTYSLADLGTIDNVTVSLSTSGGATGDLYAYLAGPNGGFSVLLNRSGVTTGNDFGYSDAGFNVTLSDTAANSIQYYQNYGYPASLVSGQETGTWQPDGVNIDPQSASSLFASTGQTAMLSSFDGTDSGGTWTLFLADLVAGNQSVEGPVIVTLITETPEPGTLTLAAVGGLAVLMLRNRHRANSK
jgi:subtilisin-like proprotein convertase family protein